MRNMELVYNSSLTKSVNSASCDRCKTARTKCDRQQPCQSCVRRGQECKYDILKTSRNLKRKRALSLGQSSPPHVATSTVQWITGTETRSDSCDIDLQILETDRSQVEDAVALLAQQTDLFQWPEDPTFDVFDYSNVWAPEYNLDDIMADCLRFDQPLSDGTTPKTRINAVLVEQLLDLYVNQIHPSIPFCRPSMIYSGLHVRDLEQDRHFGALVSAICAFVSLQAPQPHKSWERGKEFLKEATRLFADDNLGENPTTEPALTSLLIFGALWSLGSENAAWLRLQETLNLVKLLRLEEMATTDPSSVPQWLDKMYLLLGLLVVERVFAAGREHNLRIAYPDSQTLDSFWREHQNLEIQERRHAAALIILVRSFGQLDNGIMLCWRKKCNNGLDEGHCQAFDHDKLLATLTAFPDETSVFWKVLLMPLQHPHDSSFRTISQQNDGGDVLLTSLWLQNRIWHLALTHNLLSVNNPKPFLRYDYVLDLADRTIEVLKAMRMSGFEAHGQGLAEKCYAIATDFLDIADWLTTHFGHTYTAIARNPIGSIAQPPSSRHETPGIAHAPGQQQFDGPLETIRLEDNPVVEHKRSIAEIANSFLGFFALFNNGRNGKFEQYLRRYQKFMLLR